MANLKIVKVRYSVTFEASINVPENATPEQIGEELADLSIPEDEYSSYVTDSFEPENDKNGNPVIYS
jgi:hypothetical protein